jgi:hypothetical protein
MKKKKKEEFAETHPDLQGLSMGVNQFGELTTTISLERINHFLDKNVLDKKLNESEWQQQKKKKPEMKTSAKRIKKK